MSCRRIIKKGTITHFLLIKPEIILVCRRLNTIMLWMVCLDKCLAGFPAPSRSSYCLGKKLKGSFCTPIIGCIKRKICRNRSYQSNVWKIMSLDDHLGSHKNVSLMSRKRREDLLVASLCPCGIIIHPQYPDAWKRPHKHFFDLLGSCLESTNIRRSAGRTCLLYTSPSPRD